MHLFGHRLCNSCTNHILCASGRKRLVRCIYHISAQQSHQTGLLHRKCRWCESLCDSVRDRISLERTQTGWQRAGGEARLSLAASSSLAAHRDFFFSLPAMCGCCRVAMCFLMKTVLVEKPRSPHAFIMFRMISLELISVICVTCRWESEMCRRGTIIFLYSLSYSGVISLLACWWLRGGV